MNKLKVGIISEFSKKTINYGNILQSYALVRVICEINSAAVAEQIIIKENNFSRLRTKKLTWKEIILKSFKRIRRNALKISEKDFLLERKKAFCDFSAKIPQTADALDIKQIADKNYDILIVGSDVVWRQDPKVFGRIKFLDFETLSKKVSYAASLGTDWIPEENIEHMIRCLSDFDAISVREKSSVKLLESIGIMGAEYTLDPTLLLPSSDWKELEEKPSEVCCQDEYAFVYLLGPNKKQKIEIERLCRNQKLKIVTIPYASGERNSIDNHFGDLQILNCSPQNFIWLINHAEYVITDSFHGLAFSTNFRKKFVIIERQGSKLTNRLTDYLDTIEEKDKMVDLSRLKTLKELYWNYSQIDSVLIEKRKESKDFLKKIIS